MEEEEEYREIDLKKRNVRDGKVKDEEMDKEEKVLVGKN